MADSNVRVTATGSYLVTIDNDNDAAFTQAFVVEADSPPVTVWTLHENGRWGMTEAILRGGTHVLNNLDTSGPGATEPIVRFYGDSAQKAKIEKDGLGNFSLSGVAPPILTSDPHGSRSGSRGDVVAYFDGSDYFLCANATTGSGTSTDWVHFPLVP